MDFNWLDAAEKVKDQIIADRRYLHENAETGFNLEKTRDYVEKRLTEMGYQPRRIGKGSIVADLQGSDPGRAVLLRADMDALPIREESGLPFSSKSGAMHACGHDMHTAMLLGAADLLIKNRELTKGTVRFLFQAAEETLEGAQDAISSGVLENPKPDAAVMFHVLTGTEMPTGTVVVAAPGVSAPAADFFEVRVEGLGCHGSTPEQGVDALCVAARILLALQNLPARELAAGDMSVITVGSISCTDAANVIADLAVIKGTLRSFDEDTRAFIKQRLDEISGSIAKAFRAKAMVAYNSSCPTLVNHPDVAAVALEALQSMPGCHWIDGASLGRRGGGSEDFAYISHKVPSVMLALSAGSNTDGYRHPLHHPKVIFDEKALAVGSAVFAKLAEKFSAGGI